MFGWSSVAKTRTFIKEYSVGKKKGPSEKFFFVETEKNGLSEKSFWVKLKPHSRPSGVPQLTGRAC